MTRTARRGRWVVVAALLGALLASGCSREVLPSYWLVQATSPSPAAATASAAAPARATDPTP